MPDDSKPDDSVELVAPASPADGGGFRAAEYNEVATNAELLEIRLLKSSFSIEPEFDDAKDTMRLSFGRKVLSCFVNQEDSTAAAIFRYHVRAKQGRLNLLKCEADYVVIYQIPESSKPEAARAFCRNIGMFAAYPYFRALVSQLTWNASVILPPLPAIASTAHIPRKKSTAVESETSDQ